MPKLKVLKAFTWAHGGFQVKGHVPGEVLDHPEPALLEAAPRKGWAQVLSEPPSSAPSPATGAKGKAPAQAPPARGAAAEPQDPAGTAPAGSPAAGAPAGASPTSATPEDPAAAPAEAPVAPAPRDGTPGVEKVHGSPVKVYQGSRSPRRRARG